jgi:F-type H+-transporting ATPase subunit delta
MNHSKISVRYAKAIFMLAKEKNVLKDVFNDFVLIKEIISQNPEFYSVITSPIIKPSEKAKLLANVFEKSVMPITIDFLRMLVANNREACISDISRNFEDMYRKEFNIKKVILTTPEGLSKEAKDKIASTVAQTYSSDVEINDHINPDMLGGIIIRIEHQQLDLSVATQLREIKKSLKSDSYIKKI